MPHTVRALLVPLCAAAAACATPPVAQPPVVLRVNASPAVVLAALRTGAGGHGGRVTGETAESVTVDYGVEPRRVTLPAARPGRERDPDVRLTEVHRTAVYTVRDAAPEAGGGSEVTLVESHLVWHPDLRAWFPWPISPTIAR